MGCGCRGNGARQSSRAPAVRSKQQTTCHKIERSGNDVAIRVDSLGRIFLAAPLGNGTGISVSSLLPSLGCRGSFAAALKDAEARTVAIFSNPVKLDKFQKLMPHRTVRFGYLRTVLLEF